MPQVRITFTEDEIKTLCNALLWLDEAGFECSGPTHVDPDTFERLKDFCFNGKHCLEYPCVFGFHFDSVEVVE